MWSLTWLYEFSFPKSDTHGANWNHATSVGKCNVKSLKGPRKRPFSPFLVKHGQFNFISIVFCPVNPVYPICWPSRKRWRAWWTMPSTLILPRPLTPSSEDFFSGKWSPSVLVMSSCGELKHTFLDGSQKCTRNWRTLGNHSSAQCCSAGLRGRPTPVSLYSERPPRYHRSRIAELIAPCCKTFIMDSCWSIAKSN